MTESDQCSKGSNLPPDAHEEKSLNGYNPNQHNHNNKAYMIGTRILKRNYTANDTINYDSDPFGHDITVSHKHQGTIHQINKTENTISIQTDNGQVIPYTLNDIAIELEAHQSDDESVDGLYTLAQDTSNDAIQKAQTTIYIDDHTDETLLKMTGIALKKIHTAQRKKEIANETSYAKLVQSIDNVSPPRDRHMELSYRPYKYVSTAVTRPNMKMDPDGKGVLFTPYNDNQHQFNYFRYWIGRSDVFRDKAKSISDDLKTVILRDEYDLENIREDMMIDDEDSIESMILNEEEFDKYGWNTLIQNKLRLTCCAVIDVLPFYKEWINELKQYKSIDDLVPKIDAGCDCLPCPALRRLLVVSRYYKEWIKQNFNDYLEPQNTFHFSVHDFMDCLEHYNSVEFQNDYQHLQHCHIEPIAAATKEHHGDAFGLNVGNVQNPYTDDDDDDDDDCSDDDDENEKKEKFKVVLDSENRNIYEWFEDLLGECQVEKCAIFERTYRSRYDPGFENESDKYYVLNDKERNDWLERVSDVQYQRIFDGMHTILFHSSARFDCMGLGNSEEHRKFVMLSTKKRKQIKARSSQSDNAHHRGYTVPY